MKGPKDAHDDICPVVDLSKGGLCFLTNKTVKEEKDISIFLRTSNNEDPIPIEGKVMYMMRNTGVSYQYRIGVQFKPFGKKEGFNSLEHLKRLDELEKNYVCVIAKNP